MRFTLDPFSPNGVSKAPPSTQGYTPYFKGGPGKVSLLDSVNGKHGAVQIVAGDNVTIDNTGKDIISIASAPGGAAAISDTAYGSSWNGVTTIAPSKNAVYDKIESLSSAYITVGFSNADYICDGTADNVQVQAAIDALIVLGGGTVFIKSGDYSFATSVTIVGSDIIVRGAGTRTKITLANSVNREIFCVGDATTSCNNVSFFDMYLDGNKANNGGTAWGGAAGGTKNIIRYRSDAQNSFYGIVDGIYAYNGAQNGISNESHQLLTVRNCRSENMTIYGIWFENSNEFNCTGNMTQNNGSSGIKGLSYGTFTVSNNISRSDDGAAFQFQSCGNGSVVGNVAHRAGWHGASPATESYGIYLSQCADMSVVGNTIFGAYGDGMRLNGVTKSSIIGNNFQRNGQLTNNTYHDIVMTNSGGGANCTDNVITGNTFKNDTPAFYSNAAFSNIDASQTNSHTNNIIRDNVFGTPVTAKIYNLSTQSATGDGDNMVGNNANYNPDKYYVYGNATATQTLDWGNGAKLDVTLPQNTTLNLTAGGYKGQTFQVIVRQDGTGSRTVTWGSSVAWSGGSAPTLATAASAFNIIYFVWDDTKWDGFAGGSGSGAVSSVNARTGAVTGLAEDSAVVHNTGNETVAGTKTFSSDLTTSANIKATYLHTYTASRTVGATVGDTVEIGSISMSNAAGMIELSIMGSSSGEGIVKHYLIPAAYNVTGNNWWLALPISQVTEASITGLVDLDVKVDGGQTVYFRLRRAGGTVAKDYRILLKYYNNEADVFTASTTTASGVSAPSTYYPAAILTQSDSKVGIGKTPTTMLDVNGTGAFAGDVTVPDEAYDATAWNGSLEVPTKNAVRDKIETLSSGSGITRSVVSSSADFTAGAAASTDYVYLLAGAHVPTMPTAVGNTDRYTFKNNHSASITFLTTSSQTIDGGTLALPSQASVDLISNNANWYII